MIDNKARFTLRVDQELLDKLGYIAEYEGRTKNRELEQLIKKRIREFEAENGEIPTMEQAAIPARDKGFACMFCRETDT